MKKYRKFIGIVFILTVIYILTLAAVSPSLPPEINNYLFAAAVVLLTGIVIGGIYIIIDFLNWCFD